MKAAKKQSVPCRAVVGLLGALGAYGGAVGSLASAGNKCHRSCIDEVCFPPGWRPAGGAAVSGQAAISPAGYDPQSHRGQLLRPQTGRRRALGGNGPQFLSDHPNPGNPGKRHSRGNRRMAAGELASGERPISAGQERSQAAPGVRCPEIPEDRPSALGPEKSEEEENPLRPACPYPVATTPRTTLISARR